MVLANGTVLVVRRGMPNYKELRDAVAVSLGSMGIVTQVRRSSRAG